MSLHPLLAVRDSIRNLEKKSGREPNSVKLIAVSKTYPVENIRKVIELGQLDLGENKVQELLLKQAEIPEARWHLIGHLQTNKVKFIAPFIYMIHSVDSEKLLNIIQKEASVNNRSISVLLQIFISGEVTKTGMSADEAKKILEEASLYPNIQFCGLMGMAALTEDYQLIHSQFSGLRKLMKELTSMNGGNVSLTELSMGMSSDYAIAIAEGATMVRIGSAIFGKRE
jgi:pyridoxal phosphate enzyme (YggS family)